MIRICNPRIVRTSGKSTLVAEIKSDNKKLCSELWYAVGDRHEKCLCVERGDAFLVALLPLAIKLGEDIVCEAQVSAKLLFNINNSLLYLFTRILCTTKKIKVVANATNDRVATSGGVGVGGSLGVDSLAAIWKHFNADTQKDYRLTHLALFNCGQMGDGDAKSAKAYFDIAAERMDSFAQELGVETIKVDSNVNSFYDGAGVGIIASVNMRTISCALALQKLFCKYVFASSYRLNQLKFVDYDEELLEGLIVPNLSTESLEVILSCADMTRVEKETYIDKFEPTHRYLNVCCAEQLAYSEGGGEKKWLHNKTKLNCGWCDKCIRTLLAYEAMGKLESYKEIFNLEEYHQHKNLYIRHAFVRDMVNPFSNELVNLMLETKYPVPFFVIWQYKIKVLLRKMASACNYGIFRLVRRLNRGWSNY